MAVSRSKSHAGENDATPLGVQKGKSAKRITKDLQRNAKEAIKHGKTKNLAPFVNW
jgi:hypothetical protein